MFTFPASPTDGDTHIANEITYQYRAAVGWEILKSSVGTIQNEYSYVATASQTTFTGADRLGKVLSYSPGLLVVHHNGYKLVNGVNFASTDGVNVVLTVGATSGDIVEIVANGVFSSADHNTTAVQLAIDTAQDADIALKAPQSTTYTKTETDSAFVNLTTTQTIAGVKTFSSSPVMPTPALGDNSTKGATTAFVLANKSSSILRPTKTSPSSITVDGTLMSLVTPTAGTDYYFSKTAIQTVKDANTIGGFHYGLTAEAEAPTGNKTEADMVLIRGINAYSIWTKWFRPVCEPEGMVFIGSKWYDIYLLNSEHITNGTSKAGATIAAGATSYGRAIPKIPLAYGGNGTLTYGKLTWFQLCEIAKSHSKELIDYAEFPTIAYGVNEGKSSSTNGYETVAGKVEHYSNLTSKFGIEQASGVQWVWGKDLMNGYGTTAFAWTDNADQRGRIYSTPNSPTAVLLGAHRSDGVNAGSRASNWGNYVWNSSWLIGSRFSCDHLEVQ